MLIFSSTFQLKDFINSQLWTPNNLCVFEKRERYICVSIKTAQEFQEPCNAISECLQKEPKQIYHF